MFICVIYFHFGSGKNYPSRPGPSGNGSFPPGPGKNCPSRPSPDQIKDLTKVLLLLNKKLIFPNKGGYTPRAKGNDVTEATLNVPCYFYAK